MCIKHGAKVGYKRCSSEGCTDLAQKGGVCIKYTEQRSKDAAVTDALTKLSEEECALGLGQKLNTNDASASAKAALI